MCILSILIFFQFFDKKINIHAMHGGCLFNSLHLADWTRNAVHPKAQKHLFQIWILFQHFADCHIFCDFLWHKFFLHFLLLLRFSLYILAHFAASIKIFLAFLQIFYWKIYTFTFCATISYFLCKFNVNNDELVKKRAEL